MRPGQPRVPGGRGEHRRLACGHPLGRGPRLPWGTGALPARALGRARHAALRPPRRRPPQQLAGALDLGSGLPGERQRPGGRSEAPVAEQERPGPPVHCGVQPRRGQARAQRRAALAVRDPRQPRGVGVELLRAGNGPRRGTGVRRQAPRRGAGAGPGGPSGCQESGRQPWVPVLAPLALRDAEAPAVTFDGGALPPHDVPPAPARGRGAQEQSPMRGGGSAGAPALEGFDAHQVGQEPPARARGPVERAHRPAAGRALAARAPPGHLVAGPPGQAAFDASMGESRAQRVRAALRRATAVALGQACHGRASGGRRPGGQPRHRHGVQHLGASWGQGRAPRPARGIRTEAPPAGVSTEPR